jgi:hypothetical protein
MNHFFYPKRHKEKAYASGTLNALSDARNL